MTDLIECGNVSAGYTYGDAPLCELFTGMGKGVGNMFDALANPIVIITAALGIVSGVLALFVGLTRKIKEKA